jgi:replication fork protection complex subunit Tof1/Swi1
MSRAPAELEFVKNKNLSWSDQVATVIAMLLKAEHRDWVEWAIEGLELVLAARTEIVLSTDGPDGMSRPGEDEDEDRPSNFAAPSVEAREKFAQFGEMAADV